MTTVVNQVAIDHSISESTMRDVEKAVGELVQTINNGMPRDQVARAIGDHTKAIISSATAQSRGKLNSLFTALQKMDEHLLGNEQRLRAEIDRHVEIANSAARASTLIEQTVEDWKKSLLALEDD